MATLYIGIQTGYSMIWSACYNASLWNDLKRPNSDFKRAASIGFDIFFWISFYWTTSVIKTVVHVTIVDVFVRYEANSLDREQGQRRTDPTWVAWKRAMSHLFGSICLGSMFAPIVETIMMVIDIVADVLALLLPGCIARRTVEPLQRGIDNLVGKFSNVFVYTFIAISGDSFFRAVKNAATFKKRNKEQLDKYFGLIDHLFWLDRLLTAYIVVLVGWVMIKAHHRMEDQERAKISDGEMVDVLLSVFFSGMSTFMVFAELLLAAVTAAVAMMAEVTGVGANQEEWMAMVETAALTDKDDSTDWSADGHV
ncbi:hypothetical protein AMAG_14791 [Allomyces macrogynus ATCC 38327]|uniref:Protein PNS1 n=1 Tax=Allomyces macrogynus (strain ATCC 38327) TaxID=578462 RepID=A0A0L0T5C6_ALLM3|nr:hypothetical protein AMAG_14791 [Allomyces macrogynus ATCC 38327]|eukprot:KNE69950.1 hypothetical protein AMAG_14791 [Allomyces macrogynus ATCC 38327]